MFRVHGSLWKWRRQHLILKSFANLVNLLSIWQEKSENMAGSENTVELNNYCFMWPSGKSQVSHNWNTQGN